MALQTQTPRTQHEPEWMSLREFADLLGISLTSAYEYAREERLPVPAIRVGRQFRFSRPAYAELRHAQHATKRDGGSQAA